MSRVLLSSLGLAALAAAWPAHAQSAADASELEALLNQPVYAASKFAQDAAGAPASVTVLTAGDIRAYGWRTLAEILDGVRGVYLRYDRFYNYVGVRGLARPGDFTSRLLMLIDGMRVNDNIYGQAGVGREFPLDIGLIERVEFIPGPGSALYGSNAVLGVVNIVTKSDSALQGNGATGEFGSGSSRAASVTFGRSLGESRVVFSARTETRPGRGLYFPEYDDPATGNGSSAPAADRETDRKLFVKWALGEVTATGIYSERTKAIPTGAFGTVFPSTSTSGADRYAMSDVQWQHPIDAEQRLFVRAGLAQYDFAGRFEYGPDDGGLQHLDQTGRWASAEAQWHYSGWQRQRVIFGAEVQDNFAQRQRSVYQFGGVSADLDSRSRRFGLFVSDEIALRPDLTAVLGLRADRRLDGELVATPRVALIWEARPGLMLKLLDGRAYREPNAYESHYVDNGMRLEPDLEIERLRATEVALDWRALPNLRLAASVYRYEVANLIEQQQDPDETLFFANAGSVRVRGVELEADYVHASGWRARASWSAQNARESGGTPLSNAPGSLAKLNLSAPIAPLQARLGVEWQRVGSRRTFAAGTLPPHTVTNLTLQVAPPGSKVSFSASVYNLFDRSWSDPGGPDVLPDAIAQDRRQWRVQAGVQF